VRSVLLLWALLGVLLGVVPAVAAPSVPVPPNTAGARPTTLEGLAQDLRSQTTGTRGYAARELKRRLRTTARHLRRDPSTLEHQQARVERADQLRLVGPAAASCVREHPGQRANCAILLEVLADPRWEPVLQDTLPESKGRARRRILKALEALDAAPERDSRGDTDTPSESP